MRIVKNLIARWSAELKRYVIVEAKSSDYYGPVALAFGGGGGGTEVVPTGPFGPQIPYIMALFEQAANLYNQGPPQFPGFPTVAQPGQDLLASQAGIAGAVGGNVDASQTAINTALGAATGVTQSPLIPAIGGGEGGDIFGGREKGEGGPLVGGGLPGGRGTLDGGIGKPGAPITDGAGGTGDTPFTLPPNVVSSAANPLAGGITSGIGELIAGGQATAPGAAGAINVATGGVQGPTPGFSSSGSPQLGPAGLDINSILMQNLGGSGLNPFIGDVVTAATRSLTDNLQRNVLPSIGDEAGLAGQAGGTRQGVAEGIALGDYQNNVQDITARLFAQGFDRNIDVQQNALAQVGGAQGLQGQFDLASGGINEQIRSSILGQALQGAGLSQSGLSTGTSQGGNLLQAGNAQALSQLFGSLGLLPGLQGSQLAQFGALNQSGLQQLGLDQTNIDAQIQEFFFNQNAPFNALAQFQNFIGGAFGSSVGGDVQNLNFPGLNQDILQGGGKGDALPPGAVPPAVPPIATPPELGPPPGAVPPVGPPPGDLPPPIIPPVPPPPPVTPPLPQLPPRNLF